MTIEPREPVRDRDDDDEGPLDPDIELMTLYLANELSPAEDEQVEERFIHDAAFADKVGPLIYIWTAPIDFRAAYEMYAAKEKAQEQEAQHEALLRDVPPLRRVEEPASKYTYKKPVQKPVQQPPKASPAAWSPEVEAGVVPPRPRRSVRQQWRDLTFFERIDYMFKVGFLGAIAVMIPSIAFSLFIKYGAPNPFGGRGQGQGVEVPATPSRTVTTKNGSRIVVRGGSTFDAKYAPMPGVPALFKLDGEAAFDISAEEKFAMIRTSAGHVLVTPGTYAVRCEAGCSVMLLTVGIGRAGLAGDSVKKSLDLHDGEHGMVPRGGAAQKVEDSAALGFPQVEVKPRP